MSNTGSSSNAVKLSPAQSAQYTGYEQTVIPSSTLVNDTQPPIRSIDEKVEEVTEELHLLDSVLRRDRADFETLGTHDGYRSEWVPLLQLQELPAQLQKRVSPHGAQPASLIAIMRR